MLDEKQIRKMDEQDLRYLLASGIKGKDYKLVYQIYMEMKGKRKGLFDGS